MEDRELFKASQKNCRSQPCVSRWKGALLYSSAAAAARAGESCTAGSSMPRQLTIANLAAFFEKEDSVGSEITHQSGADQDSIVTDTRAIQWASRVEYFE